MRLFVTGATGFIGSHFLEAALAGGYEVTAVRRVESSKPRITLAHQPAWLTKPMPAVSCSDLEGHDALVHLAAAGVDQQANWTDCFRVNVLESLDLWIKAADSGVRRFVVCGSCFEYGKSGEKFDFIPSTAPLEPVGAYAASKAAATMAALGLACQRQLSFIVARPFHVFGEGEAGARFWPALRRAALAGEDFKMTAGAQVRDFVPVEDVAGLLLNACQRCVAPSEPLVLNLGTGHPQTLKAFAEGWWNRWQARGRLIPGAKPYREGEVMRYVPLLNP